MLDQLLPAAVERDADGAIIGFSGLGLAPTSHRPSASNVAAANARHRDVADHAEAVDACERNASNAKAKLAS